MTTKSPPTPPDEAAATASEMRSAFLISFAAEVTAARQRASMSVTDLHRATGISRNVIQGYEAGKFAPGAWELKRLCDVLRVTPNKLIYGTDKPFETNSRLRRLVGDVSKVENSSKLTLLVQALRAEEIEAFCTLLESTAISRLGTEKYEGLLKVIEVMYGEAGTPGLIEKVGEVFERDLPPDFASKLEEAARPFNEELDQKKTKPRGRKPPPA